ncbi:hypothetical protein PQH03_28995 [Ralstonia insidiosa]|jgi:hypothetical protein|uniref:Uncharacterized protein n=2 Tax=Ralstonia TaxID=48736 RepID=A0A192A834_9RALS|nr:MULTISPECIES: hypothetical protein [Ralstonia]KMW47655.1 hypothetical protein AC240_08940 [Ralstonia sp. MD27]ANJ76421.1 hypothetical protein A9Y76_27895 [Ralstonia insidiosa]MBA9869727.1 hypothetical protein [Ralstonia insidiosa]MBA9885010.1 hypothetical protein [Ralstonia pickettii]MBA9894768.1 hypothetical protein [Ralstonia pickettii]
MPITAYSREARRELDLEQWLALNAYQAKDDPELVNMPPEVRSKAASDIECSCCGAQGARLVRGARSKSTGKAIAQGHFRFRTADGANPHSPLCDYFDEQKVRGAEYRTDFGSDKTALTKAIRDLVCRGITAGLFSQSDMRDMRLWFLREKEAHAITLDVTPELLEWCVDMQATRAWTPGNLPFAPEHGALPGFDWDAAAKAEWARRNEHLFSLGVPWAFYRRQSIERPLRLLAQYAGEVVLDPSCLQDKYEAACKLSSFAATHLFGPGSKPPAIVHKHPTEWGPMGPALLALSALLLYKSDWDLQRASALYCRLKILPPLPNGLDGNLMGLNPFHDYPAWQVINSAQRVAEARTDARPVQQQIAGVKHELELRYREWLAKQ